jgi:hypothetical protein
MAKACNITPRSIKTTITGKALNVAKTVDSNFRVNAIGEIFLPIDSKVSYKNANYKVRSIVDRAVKKANQELGLSKFGNVLGGTTYTDGASIQVVVTPSLFSSYQVKNEEITIEEVFPQIEQEIYRPSGFFKGDVALAEQELRDFEEGLFLQDAITSDVKTAYTPTKQAPPLNLKLDPTQENDKGDLDSIDFQEDMCEF